MMKKFLSLLAINATVLPVISFTVACKKKEEIKVDLEFAKIFDAKLKVVQIGIDQMVFSETQDDQKFEINKTLNDFFKNLQFIALSVLNKVENTCFLNTSAIDVKLYRDNDRTQPINNNDDLKKEDIAVSKSIYISFSTITQNGKPENNNFKNLLRLDFVEYDKGMFNMEKKAQKQPYYVPKNHEL